MPSTLAREACHQPELNVSRRTTRENGLSRGIGVRVGLLFAALFVIAIFVWQGIAAHGAPDPRKRKRPPTAPRPVSGFSFSVRASDSFLVWLALPPVWPGRREV